MEEAVNRAFAGTLVGCLALLATGTARADLRVLVVSGLGGEAEYERRFAEQAARIGEAAARAAGGPDKVVVLSGDAARREAVERELRLLAERTKPDDQVAVIFIGHGSFDGEEYRFNLPGPDLTGTEIAALLDRLPARSQLVVNTTSSSGAVAERWRRDNRIVITATRSGSERNATRFAQYWAEALSSPEADRDKNRIVTAAEAFEFASRKVADAFKADAAIVTEHARLEGRNAERFLVARFGDALDLPADAELAALLGEQAEVERQLDELRSRKDSLERDRYYDELEKVLVRLAKIDRRIDQRRDALGRNSGGTDAGRLP
ncbi:MAG: hypothetical protein DIU56_001915 [Pseudomonadota bacterium]|jgi:hypothetical protein